MRYIALVLLFLLSTPSAEALQLSELSYLGTFKPGETGRGKVTVTNTEDKDVLVEFNLSDYSSDSEGNHFFKHTEAQPRSNESWIKLSTYRETLVPKQKLDVYFTIQVPNDPTLQGSYWSVVLVEPVEPLQIIGGKPGQPTIKVKLRYAYHIVTNIGEGTPDLEITQTALKTIKEEKFLALDVSNMGTLYLCPKLTLKLYNSEGVLEKTLSATAERLYPGSSKRYLVPGDGLKGKKFKAFVLLDNEDGQLFTDTFELKL